MSEDTASAENVSLKKYSVMALYKKSWGIVKKNGKSLAWLTLVGVGVSVVVTVLTTLLIINNVANDLSNTIVSSLVSVAVSILSGVFVGLIQVIGLKKAAEGNGVVPREVINESKKYVPRALQYGFFVIAVVLLSAVVIGFATKLASGFGLLLGFTFMVAIIVALFRYTFLQFIVIEPKEMPFLERFRLSRRLTDGIYNTIFLAALMGFVLGIGAGAVNSVLSSPFKTKTKDVETTIQTRFDGVKTENDLRDAVNGARDEVSKQSLDVNYVIREIIAGATSWGVGLITLGAFFELYKARQKELKL